jgi:mannose-6-phosphate isomerase-like protein (cupin superfamily)
MPKIDNLTTKSFDAIPGVHFTPIASPSRGTSETAVWRTRVLPHMPGTVHHMTREEIFVAVAGTGVVTIGEETHALAPGDAFAVPAFTDFKLECSGDMPFEAIVVLPVGGRAVVGTNPAFAPPWSL